jgi:hypothetical protein
MLRLTFASLLALAPLAAQAQRIQTTLVGRIEGNTYVSPTGAFRMTIPVKAELGGRINDNQIFVSFQDDYSTYVSVVAVAQDATERWELQTRGTKDYLRYFFNHYAFDEFKRAYKDASIESALFIPNLYDGALVVYVLLPGGSVFNGAPPVLVPPTKPQVAKRGNLIFIKNGFIYVISTELAERITEGSAYSMTTHDEDVLLRERLTDLVDSITFLPAAGSDK